MIKVEELFIEPTATVLETLRKLDETGQRILFIAPEGQLKAQILPARRHAGPDSG